AAGNGVCTLRAAVQELNASASGGVISFNLPGSAPYTIYLYTALPNFQKDTTIVGPGADKLTIRRSDSATDAFRIFTFAPDGGGQRTLFRGFQPDEWLQRPAAGQLPRRHQ